MDLVHPQLAAFAAVLEEGSFEAAARRLAISPSARLTKPAADLQWGLSATGPFTDLATATATLGTGAATAGQAINLYVRARYSWTADTPGSYSLPVQLTITAP